MKLTSSIFALLAVTAPIAQASEWDAVDKAMAAAYVGLTIVDWGQTRHIAKDPVNFHEVNGRWAIGEHPTVGQVDAFMVGTTLAWFVAAEMLPEYRTWILGAAIVSRYVVFTNHNIGLRFSKGF